MPRFQYHDTLVLLSPQRSHTHLYGAVPGSSSVLTLQCLTARAADTEDKLQRATVQSSVCPEGIHKGQISDFYCWESSIFINNRCRKNPRYRKTPSKDITGLKIKLGRKLAHDQSPEDCFEAWCKIHCFSIIQDQSEYSFVDIVLIDILIDLLNANIVLIVKAHVVTSSLEHLPLAIWSSVGDLLSNKLPLGRRFAKAQYILISVSKLCNTIIRLGVKQGNFSALYKVLNNNFVKFWLQYIIC